MLLPNSGIIFPTVTNHSSPPDLEDAKQKPGGPSPKHAESLKKAKMRNNTNGGKNGPPNSFHGYEDLEGGESSTTSKKGVPTISTATISTLRPHVVATDDDILPSTPSKTKLLSHSEYRDTSGNRSPLRSKFTRSMRRFISVGGYRKLAFVILSTVLITVLLYQFWIIPYHLVQYHIPSQKVQPFCLDEGELGKGKFNALLNSSSLFDTSLRRRYTLSPAHTPVESEFKTAESSIYTLRNYDFKSSSPSSNGQLTDTRPRVLLAAIVRDHESWGEKRTFRDFLNMVTQFDYPRELLSVGILVSNEKEYELMKTTLLALNKEQLTNKEYVFTSVKIIHRQMDMNIPRDTDKRHDPNIQKERRRLLARLRNIALTTALEDTHDAVFWIDADIIRIPNNLLTKMVLSKRDIITPFCESPGGGFYDRNTWTGERKKPNWNERKKISEGGLFVPDKTSKTIYLDDDSIQKDPAKPEYVEIDSVGGTALFVKADIHRQGVIFPTQYIVGAEWEFEGYDGIETEGICYLAQRLCYKCWGMPFDRVTHIH